MLSAAQKSVSAPQRERETERQRQTDRQRRERERERETDRQRQTDRQTDRGREGEIVMHSIKAIKNNETMYSKKMFSTSSVQVVELQKHTFLLRMHTVLLQI